MNARFAPRAALVIMAGMTLAARPAAAELIEERLRLEPLSQAFGSGSTRLDAMSLRLAARDENNEINLFDFGDNPAGLLLDRDAWSVDVRLHHQEYVERDARLTGFDFKENAYTFLGAVRKSGLFAFAGGVDFLQAAIRQRGEPLTEFDTTRYRFLFNRQTGRFSLGFEFRYDNEVEDLKNARRLYVIEHSTNSYAGIVGVAAEVHDYVTVAGRGDLRRATIDGESRTDAHLDTFEWDRPLGSIDGQVFVNHPRLRGAFSAGKLDGAGEERVEIGWSPLFFYNPSTTFQRFERQTFTEEFNTDRVNTRWELDVTPVLTLAAAYRDESSEGRTTSIPTVLGSRPSRRIAFGSSSLGLGGSLLLLNDRLQVGAEYHHEERDFEDFDLLEGFTRDRSRDLVSLGGELLVIENLAFRSGLGFEKEDRKASSGDLEFDPGLVGSFDTTTASFGVGLVPSGGILQLDWAYSLKISSDLDIDRSQFSLYARLLF